MNARSVFLLAVSVLAGPAVGQTYTFNRLGPGQATDINIHGHVVGVSAETGNATLWVSGTPVDLGRLDGFGSQARSINDNGKIAGNSQIARESDPSSLADIATIWTSNIATYIPSLAFANGINNGGQAVGNTPYGSASRINDHVVVALDTPNQQNSNNGSFAWAINSLGQVVGQSGPFSAALWNGTTLTELDSLGGSSGATSINDLGQIVGWSVVFPWTHAVLWTNGTLVDLDPNAIGSSRANDINNLSQVVGQKDLPFGLQVGMLWGPAGAVDLNSLLDAESVAAGWNLVTAKAINDNGWIVGEATNLISGEQSAYLLSVTAVPESSRLELMLVGIAFMLLPRCRRRLVV